MGEVGERPAGLDAEALGGERTWSLGDAGVELLEGAPERVPVEAGSLGRQHIVVLVIVGQQAFDEFDARGGRGAMEPRVYHARVPVTVSVADDNAVRGGRLSGRVAPETPPCSWGEEDLRLHEHA